MHSLCSLGLQLLQWLFQVVQSLLLVDLLKLDRSLFRVGEKKLRLARERNVEGCAVLADTKQHLMSRDKLQLDAMDQLEKVIHAGIQVFKAFDFLEVRT